MRERINALLDLLPRGQVLTGAAAVPAYRAWGIAGFYGSLVLTAAGGLVTGRSLFVLAVMSVVCAASFFAYTYLRKWITGFECLVLIEHVWFALAASAAVLYLLREPVLPYLDIATPGLCLFLAAGRAGCLVAGCCHGCPASLGIRYPREMIAEGFPAHWAGVRLLPVAAFELVALVAIGLTGLASLPWAAPGQVLAWYLMAYSIVRFGLEGLRGDPRPHWLGLSQARWMSLAEIGAVIWWQNGPILSPRAIGTTAATVATLALLLWVRNTRGLRGRMLHERHLVELRDLMRALRPGVEPAVAATSGGLAIAASANGHASMSLPGLRRDLRLLCEIASAAFVDVRPHSAQYFNGVLHVILERETQPSRAPASARAEALWAHAAARMQAPATVRVPAPQPAPETRAWYFRAGASG